MRRGEGDTVGFRRHWRGVAPSHLNRALQKLTRCDAPWTPARANLLAWRWYGAGDKSGAMVMIGPRLLDLLGLDIPSVPTPPDRRAASRPYEPAVIRKWFPANAQRPNESDIESKCSAARRHVMDAARSTRHEAGPGSTAGSHSDSSPGEPPLGAIDDPPAPTLRRG